jgi:ABC-type polysaccharide transport system permease subunit
MAIAETQVYMPPAPRPRLRLLEDERWLALVLLMPTLVLLGMFIAYPFMRGILLSVTNTRVGVPGDFVGLANFYKIFNDGIFRTSVYNTFVYTGVTTVFKLICSLRPSQLGGDWEMSSKRVVQHGIRRRVCPKFVSASDGFRPSRDNIPARISNPFPDLFRLPEKPIASFRP